MSWPSNMICPAVGSISRTIMRAVVVLPQPDSPTMPRVSPAATEKLTSSTLRTSPTWWRKMMPRVTGKCLVSPVTVSSASPGGVPLVSAGAASAPAGRAASELVARLGHDATLSSSAQMRRCSSVLRWQAT